MAHNEQFLGLTPSGNTECAICGRVIVYAADNGEPRWIDQEGTSWCSIDMGEPVPHDPTESERTRNYRARRVG